MVIPLFLSTNSDEWCWIIANSHSSWITTVQKIVVIWLVKNLVPTCDVQYSIWPATVRCSWALHLPLFGDGMDPARPIIVDGWMTNSSHRSNELVRSAWRQLFRSSPCPKSTGPWLHRTVPTRLMVRRASVGQDQEVAIPNLISTRWAPLSWKGG